MRKITVAGNETQFFSNISPLFQAEEEGNCASPVIGWSASTFSPHLFVEQEGTYSMTIRSRTGVRSEHPVAASSGSHPRLSPMLLPLHRPGIFLAALSHGQFQFAPSRTTWLSARFTKLVLLCFTWSHCVLVCGRFAWRCSSGDSSLIFVDSPPPPLLPPMPRHCVV